MKKILLSLGTLVVVGVIVVGATISFYNDTETSTGNIFTAGSIDLKVDHLAQTYNGVDCKTCSVTIQSDTTNQVTAQVGGTDLGPFPHSAVLVSPPLNSAWIANIPGASWIWWIDPTPEAEKGVDTTYTFQKKFTWMGPIAGATLNLYAGADNSYQVFLNGNPVGADANEWNFTTSTQDTYSGVALSPYIVQGQNTLEIKVKNWARPAGQTWDNPGGLLYKLVIDGNCGAEYFQNHCNLWQEKDLGAGDTFFNFGDVKPGDLGTDVISLHVSSNDAYSCFIVNNKDDEENSLLTPEIAAGDLPNVGNPTGFGELSNFLNVFTWRDTNGNGLYDGSETPLGSGPLSSLSSIMSMDPLNLPFLAANTTQNIGLVWCAGTLSAPILNNPFVCNGNGMGNIAQSDSFTADLTAYAEQVRNNSGFRCEGVQLPTQGGGTQALGPETVDLGAADSFALLAKTGITNTGSHASHITGNIGNSPGTAAQMDNVFCSEITGTIYGVNTAYTGSGDPSCFAGTAPDKTFVDNAILAIETAYGDAAGRALPNGTELYGGNLGGRVFAPGLYKWSTNVTIPTDVTLSGGANDVWIFQISGDLSIASGGSVPAGIKVKLIGGAQAKNVFWQVGGGVGATLGTYSTFNGTILSSKQVILQTGAVLNGRALAQTQVTLDADTVIKP